jgi:RNA polymerase sigma-70 factor (ECF subfamily)
MTPGDSVQSAGERQLDDVELIRRMKSGDKLAFSDFYDRFSRPLFSVALRILKDRSEAEEVVHEIFLNLSEKAGSFDEARGSVLNWILTLTRNHAIERLRTTAQRVTVTSDLPGANIATVPISADDLIFKEQIFAVRKALAALPADQLQALEMAYFDGLTFQEIASRSGEQPGPVTSRIRRALLKLRELLTRRHD